MSTHAERGHPRRGGDPLQTGHPLQNRVTPFGEIVAIPERGTMMGNRGILHDGRQTLRRRWAGRAWICCVLEFQGRRDPVMAPGHYTRLFFLDEPTALAAGHRPCAYCRRSEYAAFRDAWAAGNPHLGLGAAPSAAEIDRRLHEERLARSDGRPESGGRGKRLHPADLAALPDGVMFVDAGAADSQADPRPDLAGAALLRWRDEVWAWSAAGYRRGGPVHAGPVLTLTPPSIVAALAAGYAPRPPALTGS
jgi:hypothetical protein